MNKGTSCWREDEHSWYQYECRLSVEKTRLPNITSGANGAFDDISFRVLFGRIKVVLLQNKICPFRRQGIYI